MSFDKLPPNDFIRIAEAERDRRRSQPRPDLRGLPEDKRAEAMRRIHEDPHEWSAIVEWCRWWDGDRKTPWPGLGLEECDHLAKVTLRTAAAALRKWHADGRQPGEAEARASLLLKLAIRFATYLGNPTPSVGPDGSIIFPFARPERKAA